MHEGDLGRIAGPLSFLGVNYYRPHAITTDVDRSDRTTETPGSLGGWDVVPRGTPVTSMGWPVEPSGLLELLQRLRSEYSPTRIFLTENGAAFDDGPGPDGVVHDEPRIAFLRDHVAAAGQAIAAGVPLIGYLVWSLLDNFEWAEGYAKRRPGPRRLRDPGADPEGERPLVPGAGRERFLSSRLTRQPGRLA